MRIVVLILAILGSLASGAFGGLSFTALETLKASPEVRTGIQVAEDISKMDDEALRQATGGANPKAVREAVAKLHALQFAIYGLVGACVIGLVAGFLALSRKKWLAAPLLLVCAGVPLFFAFQLRELPGGDAFFLFTGCATAPLALGGLLSFFITPLARRRDEEDEELYEEERPARRPSRKPATVQDEVEDEVEDEQNFFADEAPAPRQKAQAIQRELPMDFEEPPPPVDVPAEPPPVPAGPVVARFPCPKCGMSLKKTNPGAGKPIKCPKCATTFPIPASAVEQARKGANSG